MNRLTSRVAGTAAAAVLLLFSLPVVQAEPLRLGLIKSLFQDMPEADIMALARPINRLMELQTGVTAKVSTAEDYDQLAARLADGKVQFGMFHGIEFAWARLKHPDLRPLVVAVNERPHLQACLVVRRDAPVADFADLKGKACALPRGSRYHCRLYLEDRCRRYGRRPERLFSHLVTPPDVEEALDEVVDGEVRATVVDDVALECFRREKPGRYARLKVAQRSEVFPAAVLAYSAGAIDQQTANGFRESLIQAGKDPRSRHLLTLCRMTGFEEAPEDYDQTLADVAKAYPPPAPQGAKGPAGVPTVPGK